MTAATRAAKFADEAEALGWEVERRRLREGGRCVRATRGHEAYELAWTRSESGNLTYATGVYTHEEIEGILLVSNVAKALRDMALVRVANGSLLPFDPETAEDRDILTLCANRRLTWWNAYGVQSECGSVATGAYYKITGEGAARVLHFTGSTGFRAVRLASLTGVK